MNCDFNIIIFCMSEHKMFWIKILEKPKQTHSIKAGIFIPPLSYYLILKD